MEYVLKTLYISWHVTGGECPDHYLLAKPQDVITVTLSVTGRGGGALTIVCLPTLLSPVRFHDSY